MRKVVVGSKVDRWLYDELSRLAEERGESMSSMIKELLEEKIKEKMRENGRVVKIEERKEEKEGEVEMENLWKWWFLRECYKALDERKGDFGFWNKNRDRIREMQEKILRDIEKIEKDTLKLEK